MKMVSSVLSLQTIISAISCLCPYDKEGFMQFTELKNLTYAQKEPNSDRLQIIEESLRKMEQKLENIELTQTKILNLLLTSAGIETKDDIDVRSFQPISSSCNNLIGYSHVKNISVGKTSFDILCSLFEVDNAVWLVIQRRYSGSVNFHRKWEDYKTGFGSYDDEFFIGLEKLYQLTSSDNYELLITLRDFNDTIRYAKYDEFVIDNEDNFYEIKKLGKYEGNAGDSLSGHRYSRFSTYDKDNDNDSETNCAQEFQSGWWFHMCHESNLNGEYLGAAYPKDKFGHGIVWTLFRGFDYSLKAASMAIRVKVS